MKIKVITAGSRGDIQPYVALGLGLQMAGHDVCIVTHKSFTQFIKSYGLDMYPIEVDPEELVNSEKGKKMLENGSNPFISIKCFLELYKEALGEFLDSLLPACEGADALIFSMTAFACYFVAEKLKIPAVATYLFPFNRTKAFPSVFLPPDIKLGGSFNFFSHALSEQIFWQPVRPVINKWLKKTLKMDPIPFISGFSRLNKLKFPIIYGYSSLVIPKPKEWGDWIKVTGYWYLDQPLEWQPPNDLLEFLDSGSPPVYIGFGSMVNRNPEESAEIVLRALEKSKSRGILLSGWGGLQKSDLPNNVFLTNSVPHDWLFPQMSAVVHHGGAGTTSAGLRAGIPSVIIPFFADQPFWADRVHMLGVGPKPIPRKKVTPENLAEAIKIATSDVKIQKKAARVGQAIRQENGIENAVNQINKIIKYK